MSFNLEVNHIKADAVTTAAIADDAVTAALIADDAVAAAALADDAVGAAAIAANSVGSSEIADDAVGADQIADGAVTASAIAAGAVGSSALASGAAAANLVGGTIGGALTITGNLTVDGTTTTIDSTTVAIGDHNIVLDRENSTSAVVDGAGFTIEGGSGDDVTFMWSAGNTRMELKKGGALANLAVGTITGSVANTATADALSTARAIALTGPITGTVDFDGSASVSIATTVADAELGAIAGLTSAADKVPYFTGSGTADVATFTAFGRSLVDDDNAGDARTTLGLSSLATASTVNNDQWAGTDLAVANGGTGASDAATARTNLGLAIGSDVQASNFRLNAISNLGTTKGRAIVGDGSTFALESDLYPRYEVQSYISLTDAIGGTITHSNSPTSVHVSTSSGSAATYALPAVTSANAGYKFEIAGNFGSKTLTLDGNSSQTINGATTYALNKNYQSITLEAFYADSTGFWLIK